MQKKGFRWIILFTLLIAGGASGYFYYSNNLASAAEETVETEQVQTAVARQGSIILSATGAGTIIAAEEVSLSFSSSGTLSQLNVKIGDSVTLGEVLAQLDSTNAQQNLLNAQLQLAQAAMQTDATVTQAGISYDEISVAQAELNLAQAQATLDDLRAWQPDPDEIAQLEAQLASAQASLNAARGQEAASSTSIAINNISLEQALRDLASAQEAYDIAYDSGRDWELNDPRHADALTNERDRAASSLLRAQESVQVAELQRNASVSSTSNSSSTNAEANLLNAQIALQTAQEGPTDEEIEAAQTAVTQAQLALQQTLLNQETNAISFAQTELNVQAAQEALDSTTMLAPMNGTVMAVNANVGETVSGAVIVLADLERPLLELFLDESDLAMIGLDFEVEVIFDALPDETFSGHIVQVDPQLTVSNGLSVIRAVVQLDNFARPQTFPVGMNATIEVIGGQTGNNAILVPIEALREIGDGYGVFVMENDEPQLRMVEVGLMDYTSAEIISGIEAGDIVTTGIIQTQ